MAVAENGCPYGESPIGPRSQANPLGCIIDHQLNPLQAQPEQSPAPRGHWETRWGAIAIDGVKGKVGGVTNQKSKQAATRAALKVCYSRGEGGNKDCKIHLVYYNQCATVAWGNDMYTSSGRGSLEEADRDTLQRCSEVTANCKVVYNACSNPVWVSY